MFSVVVSDILENLKGSHNQRDDDDYIMDSKDNFHWSCQNVSSDINNYLIKEYII